MGKKKAPRQLWVVFAHADFEDVVAVPKTQREAKDIAGDDPQERVIVGPYVLAERTGR